MRSSLVSRELALPRISKQQYATIREWVGEYLTAKNHKQLWVPPGFAHGFYVTSKSAELSYKCTDYYHPEDAVSLRWDDPDLAILWPVTNSKPLLSAKDLAASSLKEVPLFL